MDYQLIDGIIIILLAIICNVLCYFLFKTIESNINLKKEFANQVAINNIKVINPETLN